MDRNFINVILLGIAFMLIFTAFQTGGMIQVGIWSINSMQWPITLQKTVVDSIKEEDTSYQSADGYTSLCIIYASFALANWLAPSTIILIGPKLAMVFGGVTYWWEHSTIGQISWPNHNSLFIFFSLFIANFLYPKVWGLYFFSFIIGIGAAGKYKLFGVSNNGTDNWWTLMANSDLDRSRDLFDHQLRLWDNVSQQWCLLGTHAMQSPLGQHIRILRLWQRHNRRSHSKHDIRCAHRRRSRWNYLNVFLERWQSCQRWTTYVSQKFKRLLGSARSV